MTLVKMLARLRHAARLGRPMQDVIAKAQQHDDYWIEAALCDFTETVCQLMEESGMTRSGLAQKLDVSPAYITKLLRGDANVTIKTMVRIARGEWRFEIPTMASFFHCQ